MPGIFGFIQKKRAPEGSSAKLLEGMRGYLTHRPWYVGGTLADQRYGFGQVDVPFPGGRGPMVSEDKTLCLLLDGYLYGLTGPKAGAQAGNDAPAITPETLFSLYRRYRTDMAAMLDGEFNLMMYDLRSGELALMSDRYGMRKLYWYSDDSVFMFAPEMKAMLAYAGLDKETDRLAAADFIHYGYTLGNKTFFKRVQRIAGGTVLKVAADGAIAQKAYWTFDYPDKIECKDPGEQAEATLELLKTSVARRLKGRKKALVFLSGGLDSRLLAALGKAELAKTGNSLSAITYGTHGCSEHVLAKKVADALELRDYRMLEIKPDYYEKLYRESLWITEGLVEGFGTTARFGSFLGAFEKEMYDHVMVGPMGGPVLGGSYLKAPELGNRETVHRDMDAIFKMLEGPMVDPFLDLMYGKENAARVRGDADQSLREEVDVLNRVPRSRSDFKDWLLLSNKCRRAYVQINFNFAFTTDNFYFLDYPLFDHLYSLPPEIRAGHSLYYEIYRRFYPELAKVPYMKTGRPLFEKPTAWDARKKKYAKLFRYYLARATRGRVEMADPHNYVQYDIWYRKHAGLRATVEGVLLDKRASDRGFYSRQGLMDMLAMQKNGHNNFAYIDRLVSFEMWNRYFLDGEKPV